MESLRLALRAKIGDLFPALVPDDEFPSLVGRGQRNHQRGDHAVKLFAVAMGQKEAPGS